MDIWPIGKYKMTKEEYESALHFAERLVANGFQVFNEQASSALRVMTNSFLEADANWFMLKNQATCDLSLIDHLKDENSGLRALRTAFEKAVDKTGLSGSGIIEMMEYLRLSMPLAAAAMKWHSLRAQYVTDDVDSQFAESVQAYTSALEEAKIKGSISGLEKFI